MEPVQLASEVRPLEETLGPLPEPRLNPPLIVVSGLPGTGKSYFSARLAERLGFPVVESDRLRPVLFPHPNHHPEESARLFQAIHRLIEALLRRGIPLILDATNLSERHREHLYRIADRQEARLILVRLEAPPEVVFQRLAARKTGADWSVYLRMKPTADKIRRRHYAVDPPGTSPRSCIKSSERRTGNRLSPGKGAIWRLRSRRVISPGLRPGRPWWASLRGPPARRVSWRSSTGPWRGSSAG
ncbi:MAG: ATP-binding protein [Chloroflexota bacterium]